MDAAVNSSTAPNPSEANTAAAGAIPSERVAWLGLLAQSPWSELDPLSREFVDGVRFEWLRAPQQGLTLVRARIGNTGDRFNLGEVTVTRCALRLVEPDAPQIAGVGYVLGRSAVQAERVAKLDAMLQWHLHHGEIAHSVLTPLAKARDARHRAELERTQTSRVQFFAVQPETP